MSTAAPPYVSLTDRLANVAKVLDGKIANPISASKTAAFLHAIILYAEHGENLIQAVETGGITALEDLLTPDRAEGYSRPIDAMDPRDVQIQNLMTQLRERDDVANGGRNPNTGAPQLPNRAPGVFQASPHADVMTGQAPSVVQGPGATNVLGQPYQVPDTPPETHDQLVARLERELAAARGNTIPTTVTVEHEPDPQTAGPDADATPSGEGDPS